MAVNVEEMQTRQGLRQNPRAGVEMSRNMPG